MQPNHHWHQVRRFSIRKLTIGVVSATIGLAIINLTSYSEPVLAQQTAIVHPKEVTITYHYVSYGDLTSTQRAALREGSALKKEVATQDAEYVLVYREDKGIISLPETSDSHSLHTLLAGLGISAVLIAITRLHKKMVVKVLVVTALSGAALTAANSRALETGLRILFTETHLVKLGQTLPEPQSRFNGEGLTYYLPQTVTTPRPQNPENGAQPQAEKTDAATTPRPQTPEHGEQLQAEKTENETSPQPQAPENGGQPQVEKTDAATAPRPQTPEHGEQPQAEKTENETSPQPQTPEHGEQPQAEKTENETAPQLQTPKHGEQPQAEKTENETSPQPQISEHGEQAQAEKTDAATAPQPQIPENGEQAQAEKTDATTAPQPQTPEHGEQPRAEKTENETIPQAHTPEHGEQLQAEKTENEIIPRPQTLEHGEQPQAEKTDAETHPQPHTPENGEQPQAEKTDAETPLQPQTSEHGEQPQAEKTENGTPSQPHTPEHGEQPQAEKTENGTAPQPQTPENGEQPQAEKTDVATPPRPQTPEHGEQPQAEKTSAETAPQLQIPEHGEQPQAEKTENETIPQPPTPENGEQTQVEKPAVATAPQLQIPEHGEQPQAEKPAVATAPRPQIPENGEQPQAEKTDAQTAPQLHTPEHGEQPQSEKPAVATTPQPQISEHGEQPQAEKPAVATAPRPQIPENGEQSQAEKTENGTPPQPHTPEHGEQLQAEKTENETIPQPHTPENGEQPQAEKPAVATAPQPPTPENGEQLQTEKTENETIPQPQIPENGDQPQAEKMENGTAPQAHTPEHGEQVQAEKPDVATASRPQISEHGEQPQAEKADAATAPQAHTPEHGDQAQAEKTENETIPQPHTPENGDQPQAEKPDVATAPQPHTPENGDQPQAEKTAAETAPQLHTPEHGEQPQAEKPDVATTPQPPTPEHGEQPQAEKPDVATAPQPQISEHGDQPQAEKTESGTPSQPQIPENGAQPQVEHTAAVTPPQPHTPEHGDQPQAEKTDVATAPQPQISEHGEQPQAEKTDAATAPQPPTPEHGEQPQAEKPDVATAPRPQIPENGAQPQAEITAAETAPQPQTSEHGAQPQAEKTENGTPSQPHTPEHGDQPQAEKTENGTAPRPQIPENGEQSQAEKTENSTPPQPHTPEHGEQLQAEKTENETSPQRHTPENGEQPQAEKTENETPLQPQTLEHGEQPQAEKTENETSPQPHTPEHGDQPQAEKTDAETAPQPPTPEHGEQPQAEKTENGTPPQPHTPEHGEQPLAEKTDVATAPQLQIPEHSEQPLAEKMENGTAPQAHTPEHGDQPQADLDSLEGTTLVMTTASVSADRIDYLDTDELYLGETQEISPAVPGEMTIATTYKTVRGEKTEEVVGTPVATITKQPIPARVKRGTKSIEGTKIILTTAPVTTDQIDYLDTDELYLGEIQEISPAVPGEMTIATTYKTVRGEKTEEVIGTPVATITKQPIPAQIKRGRKAKTQALLGNPQAVTQTVKRNQTVQAQFSIRADSAPDMVGFAWKDNLVPDTSQANPNLPATVTITYQDGSSEDVAVSIQVQALQADIATPQALKQTVIVGEVPQASASISLTSAPQALTYAWKQVPETTKVAANVPGLVIITYDDQSTDEVTVVVDVVQEKTKPILTLAKLTKQDEAKKITLDYDLTDPSAAYVSANLAIYDGTRLVTSQNLQTFEPFEVPELDWFVPYTLKTSLVYEVGNGQKIELLKEVPFELTYKKVEIKHVDRVELYEKQDDGNYLLVEKLTSQINDFTRYYAKIIDDNQKDIYLPLVKSEETTLANKPVFKLTAAAPQLIEHSGQGRINEDDYHFYIPKMQPPTDGRIRSFEDLINALRAQPAGDVELADDLDASKFTLANGATSYIPEDFSGRLLGNNHHIKGLKAPLFNTLMGAFEIKDLALAEVNINQPKASEIGALAKYAKGTANRSKVTNVAVQGTITANRSIGGLIYQARDTTFENISFDGNIQTTNNGQANITGGLIGYLRGSSRLTKARVAANITVEARHNPGNFHVGMAVGSVGETNGNVTTPVARVVATGLLANKAATDARVGGLVGSMTTTGRLREAVSQVSVINGKPLLGGKLTPATPNPAASVVQINETGDSSAIAAKVKEMGISVKLADFVKPDINKYDVDYSQVAGYQADHQLRYRNLEKFLPFYNKEFIVRQAKLLPEGKLTTNQVVAVVPMAGHEIIADYAGRQADINKLLVRYADGSVDYLNLTYKEEFRDTRIAEYAIAGTELIYTPNQLASSYKDTVAKVLPDLAALDYYDENFLKVMNKDTTGSSVKDLMDKLYLKESFEQVKAKLSEVISGAVATSTILFTKEQDLAKYILDNKEALLLGMAYVNKWYNFNFEHIKAKDLLLFYQDFYGKKVDSLEWLIGLGRQGYDVLNPTNNVTTYASQFAPYTGQRDLLGYLSSNRKDLTTYRTDNDWFKATSKAYVAERPSKVLPDRDVSVFSLLSTPNQQNGILPLLTTRGETFIITSIGAITYGLYDRYYGHERVRAAGTQAEKEAVIRGMVDQAALWQRDHFDFWYRNAPANVRERLIKPMVAWDGYQIPNRGPWLAMFGDNTRKAVLDFFGPIGSRAHYGNSGAGAVANGTTIYFMFDQVLTQYGSSVFTHEAVHNNDGTIYLGGFGRRFGQGAELFAQGFLQTPTSHRATDFGINTMYDFAALGQADATNRYHALSPERYKTSADLQEYFHGAFDVLYTLDYAEAEVVLKNMTTAQQSAYFNKIENYYVQDPKTKVASHAGNQIRRFTESEWAGLNIRTVYDLIDHDAVTRREHAVNINSTLHKLNRNGYYYAQMFSPIYSALSNDKGAPGDLMFRRMAYELLAEKGYEDGFIPYSSDKLAKIAKERGSTGTATWNGVRTVGNVTDAIVLDVVFNGKYKTWAEFKKEMFRQRIEKIAHLKPVTISYNNRERVLASYTDIENLLKEALEEDKRRFGLDNPTTTDANNRRYANNSRVKEVKAKIFNAYLRLTDDFRNSIYKP